MISASKYAYQASNVLVAHLEDGIEAVHLYSGHTLRQWQCLPIINDGQDAKLILALQVAKLAVKGGAPERDPTSKHAYQAPNVLVAHLEEGIEAVHLYSGRTLCKLHLPTPGLHADLNGDGVLDHVQARAMTCPNCMPYIRLAESASGNACGLISRTSVQAIRDSVGMLMWSVMWRGDHATVAY